jgi:hypothetical protein
VTSQQIQDMQTAINTFAKQVQAFGGSIDEVVTQWKAAFDKLTTPMSESSKVPVKELLAYNRPLRLQTALVYNVNAALRWAQFHNALAPVRDGATAEIILPVPSQNTASLDFRQGPYFSSGLYVCGSTTDQTKTITTTNDLIIFCTFARA